MKKYQSFSLVEVILAIAIFIILAVSGITLVLHSFSVNKLGEEQTNATLYAQEGIEAVGSIKNQDWSNLVASTQTYGLTSANGYWEFSGTQDIKDKYTRSILISAVNRDANGNIVDSGGTTDKNTMKVTSTVSWNFSGPRNDSVTQTTYMTNFRKPIVGDGIVIYGDGSSTPKYKLYDSFPDSFEAEKNTIVASPGQFFSIRTSPVKTEAVAGYVNSSGVLQIVCFDGKNWTNEWNVSVGGTGTTRRFDIGYETNSGDVIVVYSQGTAATNALSYKTKPGTTACGTSNWSSASDFSTASSVTTGTVQWVTLATDPRSSSDNLTVLWADSNSDLGVNNWSGTSWATGGGTYKTLETDLERISTSQDVDNFGVAYESQSGNIMVVWGNSAGANNTNGARYSRCVGGTYTCTWTATASVPRVSDDVHNLDIAANQNTNEIVYAAIGASGDDLTAAYWSGSAWTGYPNVDTTTENPFAGSKLVAVTWLINGAQTRWVINYDDKTGQNISWYTVVPGSNPVKQVDFNAQPKIGDLRERFETSVNPLNKSEAMVVLTNSSNQVFAKRMLLSSTGNVNWSNSDSSLVLALTAAVPQQGFSFTFWRNP